MERFKIEQTKHDGYCHCYVLKNDMGQEYNVLFEFYDIEQPPQKGENIYFSEKIFYEISKYGVQIFMFGGISEVCGREVTKEEIEKAKAFVDNHGEVYCGTISDEIFAIERNNERIFLKRFYG